MASSKYPVVEPEQFYKSFPHLNKDNHKPTSNATPEPGRVSKPYYIYNCFAFVVGDRKKFWWPDYPYSYWPKDHAPETVEELMRVLHEHFGYEECADGKFEKGVQKIAIFVNGGVPVHVAIQPSSRNGVWQSKMSYNIDMEHELKAIETWPGDDPQFQGFGIASKFMKLARRSRR